MSLPNILYNIAIFGAIAFIAVDLIAILLAYRQLTRRLKNIEGERDALKKNVEQNAEAVLEEARKQSMVVLQRAQEKAQQILSETKQFQLDAKRILESELKEVTSSSSQELQKASTELITNYEATLNQLKEQDINLFATITKTIEKDVAQEMDEFKAVLEKETLSSQKIIEEKLQEQYSQVGKEIQEYKAQQLTKVDNHILELVHTAVILALGKSVTLDGHQELVLQALEEAKKQIGT